MTKRLNFTFIFALFFSSLPVHAFSDVEIREKVQSRLADRHPSDTPEWWRSLGDNAAEIVISMYGAENNTFHRIRLLQGLGWMDSPQAVDFIQQQTEQTQLDVLQNAGIRSLGRGQGAKQADFIAKFLKSENAQTRFAAAETLREISDPKTKEIYERFLKEEKTPWLQEKLRGALGVKGSLRPVSSSEDYLSSEFEGTWRGFWVSPQAARGLKSSGVSLSLKPVKGDFNSLSGELKVMDITPAQFIRSLALDQVKGKGLQFQGRLLDIAKPEKKLGIQASLSRVGETQFLEIRIPDESSVLFLRKD